MNENNKEKTDKDATKTSLVEILTYIKDVRQVLYELVETFKSMCSEEDDIDIDDVDENGIQFTKKKYKKH